LSSIRRNLIWSIVGGLALLTIIFTVSVYVFASNYLLRHFDSALLIKARAISALVEQEPVGQFHSEFTEDDIPEFVSRNAPHYFEIRMEDGTVLQKSSTLKTNLPDVKPEPGEPEEFDIILNGKPGRAVAVSFYPLIEIGEKRYEPVGDQRKMATVIVARHRKQLDERIVTIMMLALGTVLVLPICSAILVIFSVKWGLRPLEELSTSLKQITSPYSMEEINPARATTETQPIIYQLNALLLRLREAFERERRFTSNASHELRTPLAEVRAAMEVALKWPSDSALMVNSCQTALEATRNMQHLIDMLLAVARADLDGIDLDLEPLDLQEVFEAAWEQLTLRAQRRSIDLAVTASEAFWVESNRVLTLSIAVNLLENAIEYSAPGSMLEVELLGSEYGSSAVVEVRNHAIHHLSPADLHNMFQALWRKEASRAAAADAASDELTHAGLGLALVQAYCQLLDVEITASQDTSGVVTVRLIFPRRLASQKDSATEQF